MRLREEKGVTSIAITHDLLCAEIIADDVHFLHEGVIFVLERSTMFGTILIQHSISFLEQSNQPGDFMLANTLSIAAV